ncbi:hypothetical protein B0H10DRAFT_2223540 [Mycena sp. CBHHK59/15]|nr:hypothetical protein B0H10DRAFT_2223540 [Mycena sp. CBHHK59/15]
MPITSNVLELKTNVKIEGPVTEYKSKAASGNTVTRVFCSNCDSAITHLSTAFGESQATQTGNFADFADVPIGAERTVGWNCSCQGCSSDVEDQSVT